MTVTIVGHPLPGYNGTVVFGDTRLVFIGGFTGPTEVPADLNSRLAAEGFDLDAVPPTPAADPLPQYVRDDELSVAAVTSVAGLTGALTAQQTVTALDVPLRAALEPRRSLALSPLAPQFGAAGDGVTDDLAELTTAIAAASVGEVIDLGGRTYAVSGPLVIDKSVTLRNGRLAAGDHRVARITAADVTFDRVAWSRGSIASGTPTTAERSGVVVEAQRFKAIECNGGDANLASLYFLHGVCTGSRVIGGRYTNNHLRQDSCGIYAQAGPTGNLDIVVDGAAVDGTACHGIVFFDSSGCVVRNPTVRNATRLPTITYTGWTLVSGNLWRVLDSRTDGGTRVIRNNGTELTENTATPTTPGANRWGVSGGFVYLDLNGTDPNTRTITSDIVSGYGIAFYASAAGGYSMSDNAVINPQISDVDGIGVYMQLDKDTAYGNAIRGGLLRNVCTEGVQSFSLPFAGIGWGAGRDSIIEGVTIDGVGSSGKAAPGVATQPPSAGVNLGSGRMVGVSVANATSHGFDLNASGWSLTGCVARANASNGFDVTTRTSGDDWKVTFTGCEALSNGLSGFAADANQVPGSRVRATITGGRTESNTQRGAMLYSVRDSRVIGLLAFDNGSTSFPQIFLRGTCSSVVVDDCTAGSNVAGQGIVVEATCTDVSLGVNHLGSNLGTPLTLGTYVRVGGTPGAGPTFAGTGSPEGVVTANTGAQYRRTDGGAGTSVYVKESAGLNSTGWVAK